jgi:hypothetical protein
MYTKAAAWATFATPLPMWGVEGSGMAPLPNMVADFRDTKHQPQSVTLNEEGESHTSQRSASASGAKNKGNLQGNQEQP